jgi:hypothetical protein
LGGDYANGIDRGEYSRKRLYLMLRKIPQELVRLMKPIVERRAVAIGYLVRVLTNESESRVFGNLGKNTLATVTSVFGHIVAFG